MGQQTWQGAAREVGRAALRHKVLSAVIAVCVAGSLIAIGMVGSASGQAAPGQAARPAPVAAPAFSLPILGGESGQQVALSKYQGQPLIINFFASWCEPCKTETPLLAKFYRTEKGKVALVGLDENDTVGNATSFTRADGDNPACHRRGTPGRGRHGGAGDGHLLAPGKVLVSLSRCGHLVSCPSIP